MFNSQDIVVVGGNGNHDLDKGILSSLNTLANTELKFSHLNIDVFPDGEADFRFLNWRLQVRGKEAIVFQSMATDTEHTGQEYGWEFLQIVWALKHQYGVSSVIAVVPFMLYRRQDHPEKEEEIHRNLMFLQMIKFAGVDKLILCDIHSQQTMINCEQIGLPVWNVDSTKAFAGQLKPFVDVSHREGREFFIYAPDAGSVPRAVALGKLLEVKVAVSLKNRAHTGEITVVDNKDVWERLVKEFGEQIFLAGHNLKGVDLCTRDDEVTTATTASKTGWRLRDEFGVNHLFGCFTHPVCVPGWKRVLVDSGPFQRLFCGNSIYRGYEKSTGGEVVTVDLAPVIAETLFEVLSITT